LKNWVQNQTRDSIPKKIIIIILELKPRVFSSLINEMELGLGVLLKSKEPHNTGKD
jgi:hypothetical protein